LGTDYREYIVLYLAENRRGNADLCAYFFLRAASILKAHGAFGLLAVNTIAEGDTRQVGLEAMLHAGVSIFSARPNFAWPGAAAVVASSVHGVHGKWNGRFKINGDSVSHISALLTAEDEWSPLPLAANADRSFLGSVLMGMGFTISPEEALAHIANEPRNSMALLPYVNGEDLNSHPAQRPSRWVINFWDWPLERSVADAAWLHAEKRNRDAWMRDGRVPLDYPGPVAADFPILLSIVEARVKPERQRVDSRGEYICRNPLPQRWWHHADKRPALYHTIGRGGLFSKHPEGWREDAPPLSHVIAFAQTSKTKYPHLLVNNIAYDQKVVVIASSDRSHFAVLSSSVHYAWVHLYGSRMKTDAVYAPSDVYETFPFPTNSMSESLYSLGEELHEFRQSVLSGRGFGLTQLYKLVHAPGHDDVDIQRIREIHCNIDIEVVSAYGWSDIRLDHGFHEAGYVIDPDKVRYTVSESARMELMRRLAALNRQRFRDEQEAAKSLQAALEERSAPSKRPGRSAAKKSATPSAQTPLFD
jgi:hypothetical protein